jgi:stress response protein SCP2
MTAANGAVRHSGDNRSGVGDGDDEFIQIDLENLPSEIKIIVFIVTAHTEGGSFKQVNSAGVQLRDLTPTGKIILQDITMACHGDNTALILGAIVR